MRLFGRKRKENEVEERCPHCGEPVPDEATHCMMCGVDLRPLRASADGDELKSPDPGWTGHTPSGVA